ncbi:uncharacterized protein HD556DRAFT_1346943 [Suillus plorans]|uniref:Secreted protein n=1 Tax=Suillus plorans TaxID=116603 RepID=A0A9P7DNN3_9AGAM|nr:uncharacterized protein HD556DRAFT_1346943 [Suillus plorans]KAG1799317.1 hypothetical protein HD556DRAFT_1346943 [Suillus plorans]
MAILWNSIQALILSAAGPAVTHNSSCRLWWAAGLRIVANTPAGSDVIGGNCVHPGDGDKDGKNCNHPSDRDKDGEVDELNRLHSTCRKHLIV